MTTGRTRSSLESLGDAPDPYQRGRSPKYSVVKVPLGRKVGLLEVILSVSHRVHFLLLVNEQLDVVLTVQRRFLHSQLLKDSVQVDVCIELFAFVLVIQVHLSIQVVLVLTWFQEPFMLHVLVLGNVWHSDIPGHPSVQDYQLIGSDICCPKHKISLPTVFASTYQHILFG